MQVDVFNSVVDYAVAGWLGLWPYLMTMPLEIASALGFTAMVLMMIAWLVTKIFTKTPIAGRMYGFVSAAIVVTWLFVWFAAQPWGVVSDFSAGVARVASLIAVFWIVLLLVQSWALGRQNK